MSSETLHGSSLDGFISIRQLLDTVWDVRIPSKHLALIGTIFATEYRLQFHRDPYIGKEDRGGKKRPVSVYPVNWVKEMMRRFVERDPDFF